MSPLVAACEAGTAKSCLVAGDEAEQRGDAMAAASLYRSACELGEAPGCALAGGLLAESGDLAAAREVFVAGCELDDATSCYGAGLVLGGSFGGAADLAGAAPSFERGCELGLPAACGELARLYQAGQGVPVDLERATALRAQACEAGDGESCTHLGLEAWRGGDRAAARALFEQSCATELPDSHGCGYFGWMLWSSEDDPDEVRGIAMMDASCAAGSAIGCSLRASTFARLGDLSAGDAHLKKACELDPAECRTFSDQYEASKNP